MMYPYFTPVLGRTQALFITLFGFDRGELFALFGVDVNPLAAEYDIIASEAAAIEFDVYDATFNRVNR